MVLPIVIKVSGSHLDDDIFIEALAETLKTMNAPIVLVHGGGRAITQMQYALDIETEYVDGLRVTDDETMDLVEMVLCGAVNTRITRTFVLHGIDALGLNGADRGLIRAEKLEHPEHDLGRVGKPTSINDTWLKALLIEGVMPVVSPVGMGDDGAYNINADHVAGAIAQAISASRVIFVSNVPGVIQEGVILPTLTTSEIDFLIETGVITEGMIPKVRTTQQLIARGIQQVVITDLDGLLAERGTTIIPDAIEEPQQEERLDHDH